MNVETVSYRDPKAPEAFVRSLRETGFAVLSDHPIPASLINDTYSEWSRFFASPDKQANRFDRESQCGYFPFRSENAKDAPVKDLKEFFHHYPRRRELPTSVQASTPKLYDSLNTLGAELLSWIEKASPAEIRWPTRLTDMIVDSEETLLRVLHYPPLSGSEEPGAVRAAAHEDINLITLLTAATAPGLEVKDSAGRWHKVACDPGTIVVNAGDMLQEASQGYFPSTTHRVMNPPAPLDRESRYSMPLFLHPKRAARLSDRYTAGAYLDQRLREIGLKN